MRTSVIVTSVNASFNTISRSIDNDGGELKFSHSSTTLGTRPFKVRGRTNYYPPRCLQGSLKVGRTRDYEEFTRPTRPELINQENLAEQAPLPRPISPRSSSSEHTPIPTDPVAGDSVGYPSNTPNDAVDMVSKEGVFLRCFILLKRVGGKLVMPPYTIDGGLNRVARKHDYINVVGHRLARGFAVA